MTELYKHQRRRVGIPLAQAELGSGESQWVYAGALVDAVFVVAAHHAEHLFPYRLYERNYPLHLTHGG